MPYKIVIKLDDKDSTPHLAMSAGKYFSDALTRMQVASYSVDRYRDDATLMIQFPKNPEK